MPRHILTVDLGFGDSGKGSIVDALCRHHKIDTVVRYSGGPQCAHNVITPEGVHHTFAQFGSGALAGAYTILTKDVLVDPIRLINEGLALQKKGVDRPFTRIYVHKECLVITPFHRALNQIKEELRGDRRHGSCGVGVGAAAKHALKHPDHALRVKHLSYPDLRERLVAIRDDLIEEAGMKDRTTVYGATKDLEDQRRVFIDPNLIDAFCWRYKTFSEMGIRVDVLPIGGPYARDMVFEGAQGVLLDEDYGFPPYTTWSKVTLANAIKTLADAGIHDYETLGILRCYGCRHGPGPFPTEHPPLARTVKEQHNGFNEWQRGFRVGWFDMWMAKYAVRVAGGRIDRLAITHLDQIKKRARWKVALNHGFDIGVGDMINPSDTKARTRLTEQLMKVKDTQYWTYPNGTQPNGDVLFGDGLCKSLDISPAIFSYGPTAADKQFIA